MTPQPEPSSSKVTLPNASNSAHPAETLSHGAAPSNSASHGPVHAVHRQQTTHAGSRSKSRRRALKKIHDHEPERNVNAVALRLMNNGSVARDHLASERTFLAYVRTSLGMASAGVALMQFLLLGESTKALAAPVGGAMVVTGVTILVIGSRRFFLVQRSLVEGVYPPSFLDIIIISLIWGCIVTGAFFIVVSGRYRAPLIRP